MLVISTVLAAGLLSLLAVRLRAERPDPRPKRLPVMLLLSAMLGAGAVFAYYPAALFFGYVIEGWLDQPLRDIVLWLVITVLCYLVFLIARLFARLLHLSKKHTLTALTLLFVILLVGVYVLYVRISGNYF